MREQNERFQCLLDRFIRAGIRPRFRHAANSGAVQSDPGTHYDLVRPGLLTYGCPPLPGGPEGLRPALVWKSKLVQVKRAPKGARVGYGWTAQLTRDSRLAVVPVGYADGWPRALSNRGGALVNGGWAPVVGRVSMDQFTIDVTDLPEAALGDEVILCGRQGSQAQTLEHIAQAAGTNVHDILAGLSDRLPRITYGARPFETSQSAT